MSSDDAFLDAAVETGRRIARDAVWYDGRCNWVGAAPGPEQPWRSEYRALGSSLYDGTAGVGLFLAELAAATGDAAARRTAVGALRHAAASPGDGDGFHGGSLGIAFAAARAAVLLGEEELHAGARRVTPPPARPDRCPDVVLGSAGAILGLLALAEAFEEPSLIADAVATGAALVERATITAHGWSWADPGRRHPRHLCGLSHGAAGIGWALLELFAATRDERFRAAAAGAFDYERSWLDPGSGTWPDLRIAGARRGVPRAFASPAAGTWCHGEAGIALTRLRAIEVLGPGAHGDDAVVALETTRRVLADALPHEIADLTLCHGAAGAAEALLCGTEALGGEGAEAGAELARLAIERHGGAAAWPCENGTTPVLFRGLSGIGWWFLRLHGSAVPSPLALPAWRLTRVRPQT